MTTSPYGSQNTSGMAGTAGTSRASGRSTVVGVFEDRRPAEEAVAELERLGFGQDQIGFAIRDGGQGTATDRSAEITTDTGAGSGALTGLATGGVLGGLIGAAAALLLPGVGPIVAAGILGPVLGGAAAGAGIGAVGGGIIGGLVTTGVPEEEARYYDQEFQQGRAIVTVKAGDRYAEAQRVLRDYGAYDVESGGASTAPRMDRTASTTTTTTSTAKDRETTAGSGQTAQMRDTGAIRVPEVEERLNVEKREAQMGEVRVHREVTEERKTVPVDLKREEVHVERRDVERPMRAGEDAFKEGTISVPVRGEQAVVSKEAVVTGEVVLNKERTTEHQDVSDTVRRTEVHVDDTTARRGAAGVTGARSDSDWNTASSRYRTSWQQRYGNSGGRWEDYEPAYRFGYDMRSDPRYAGRRFDEVESDLRKDWTSRHSNSPWDKFKANVREAWEDVKH